MENGKSGVAVERRSSRSKILASFHFPVSIFQFPVSSFEQGAATPGGM
jgi:hypothetical protein